MIFIALCYHNYDENPSSSLPGVLFLIVCFLKIFMKLSRIPFDRPRISVCAPLIGENPRVLLLLFSVKPRESCCLNNFGISSSSSLLPLFRRPCRCIELPSLSSILLLMLLLLLKLIFFMGSSFSFSVGDGTFSTNSSTHAIRKISS